MKCLKSGFGNNKKDIVLKVLAIVTALLIWQIAALLINSPILIVGPVQVFLRLISLVAEPAFWSSIAFSLLRIFIGFISGMTLGIALACLAYRFKPVRIFLWPLMATVKAVPVASFVVICLIWLSPARLSSFISFLIVLPIVYQNTLTAMNGLDKALTDLAKLERLSYFKQLTNIFFPNITDQILSTASLCAGIAWKSGVAAEVIGTPHGSIGQRLYLSKIYLATDDLLAWTVVIVLLSVGFEKLFVFLLSKLIKHEGKIK